VKKGQLSTYLISEEAKKIPYDCFVKFENGLNPFYGRRLVKIVAKMDNTLVLRIPTEIFDTVIRPYISDQFEVFKTHNFNEHLTRIVPGILDLAEASKRQTMYTMPEFRAMPAKMVVNQSGMDYFSYIIEGKITLYAKTGTSANHFGSKSSSI
jgi:hypothetical protein